MKNSAIWPAVLVLAVLTGACDEGTEKTGPAEEAISEPKKVITNSVGMKLVLIPAGEFMMGSSEDEKGRDDDEKQHDVRITKPFYLGVHEVTVGQFGRFVDDTMHTTEAEKIRGPGCDDWTPGKGVVTFDRKHNWRK